jgi:hypothetical protein
MNASLRPFALICLGLVLPASAATLTLTPIKDNTLFSTETTSNGAGNSIFSGMTGPNGGPTVQRAVVAFDVAGSLPAGATVTSVTLTLNLLSSGSPDNQTLTLHRVTSDWGEGTSSSNSGAGGPATANDATWLHTFFSTQFWATPGGDFDPTVSASHVVGSAAGDFTWASTAQFVADVQDMLDNPAGDFGWLVQGNEVTLRSTKKFSSRETPVAGQEPRLIVEFDDPTIPTVSEWGLLIATLLVLAVGTVVFGRSRSAGACA